MGKKNILIAEDVNQRVFEKFKGKFSLVNFNEYVDSKQKVEVKCNDCGNIFIQSITGLLYENHKHYCDMCRNKEVNKKFLERLTSVYGDEYTPLENYHDCKTKLRIRHNACGNIFNTTGDYLFNGKHGCPVCNRRKNADKLFKTQDEIEQRIFAKHGNEYTVIGKYKGYDEKITVIHNKCGRTIDIPVSSLLGNKGCIYCGGKAPMTTQTYQEELEKRYGNEYSLLSGYKNAKTKVTIRHNKCGYVWDINPYSAMVHHGCPNCNKSKGEIIITNILDKIKIEYASQYCFDDCKDKTYLPFDFYIPSLNLVIEYDGIGHYQKVNWNGCTDERAEETFIITKKHDNMKTEYCKSKNIDLLRIPYWDYDNIENILGTKFKEVSKC